MIQRFPNMLIVAGTGRNVGKTSLACALISQTSISHKVIGVKISPHFHEHSVTEKIILEAADFEIIEELNPDGNKDSSRMLKAGASRVLYVQTKKDRALLKVIEKLKELCSPEKAIICESGGLRHIVEPGLFIVCKSQEQTEIKAHLKILESKVDLFVKFRESGFDLEISRIKFENGQWLIEDSH